MSKRTLIFFVICLVAPLTNYAQTQHNYSATISPASLFYSAIGGSFENRISNKVSVVALPWIGADHGSTTFGFGAEGRYYVFGGFEQGLNLGLGLHYDHSKRAEGIGNDETLFAPITLGYKYIAPVGLTVDLAVGAGPWLYSSRSDWHGFWTTQFWRANVGWSF